MKVSFVAFTALLALFSQGQAQTEDDVGFMNRTVPLVNLSESEIKDYAKNKLNKPKLDFKPKGKQAQPKSAGLSYLKNTASQIIGGTKAAQKQFPWQVYLNVDKSWLCGGSIISTEWVLTAGHCVYKASSFVVTAGGVDSTSVETGEQTQTSKTAYVHEKYDDYRLNNDIALIKLPTAFVLGEFINVIKLPKQSDATKTFVANEVTVSGYGMTANTGPASPIMNFVTLTVIDNKKCVARYGKRTVTSSVICTAASPSKTICSGDSGGPLIFKGTDGKFSQVGIVSFSGTKCTNNPAGYTRVTSFLGWISQKTGIKLP